MSSSSYNTKIVYVPATSRDKSLELKNRSHKQWKLLPCTHPKRGVQMIRTGHQSHNCRKARILPRETHRNPWRWWRVCCRTEKAKSGSHMILWFGWDYSKRGMLVTTGTERRLLQCRVSENIYLREREGGCRLVRWLFHTMARHAVGGEDSQANGTVVAWKTAQWDHAFWFRLYIKGEHGHGHVLIINKDLSPYAWLYPGEEITAEATPDELLDWSTEFEVSWLWLVDRGLHLKNEGVNDLQNRLWSSNHFMLRYCLRSNRTVEVVGREMETTLKRIMSEFSCLHSCRVSMFPVVQEPLHHSGWNV